MVFLCKQWQVLFILYNNESASPLSWCSFSVVCLSLSYFSMNNITSISTYAVIKIIIGGLNNQIKYTEEKCCTLRNA